MKTLYLLRHAKSSWKFPELSDFDRPLNRRGKHDAPMMGKRLLKRGINPDLVMSSPALRARKTAKAVAKKLNYSPSAIRYEPQVYEASVPELLALLQSVPDQVQVLILAGHNPELTSFANQLALCSIDNIVTAGVVAIEFPVDRWSDLSNEQPGQFLWYDYPKRKPS